MYCLSVYPRVGVIELKQVDSLLQSNKWVHIDASLLLHALQEFVDLFLALELPLVINADIHVETLHANVEINKRVLLKYFQCAELGWPVGDLYNIGDTHRVEGLNHIPWDANERGTVHLFENSADPDEFVAKEFKKFIEVQFAGDFEKQN